jgi:CheY-like chemotaxis protein
MPEAESPRILVVEDETLVRMAMVDALEVLGCDVAEAHTGSAALDIMRRRGEPLTAAIVDVGLPDCKGDVLARELRTLEPELPILIASGYTEKDVADNFADDPRTGFLAKPYQVDELESALRGLGVDFPHALQA